MSFAAALVSVAAYPSIVPKVGAIFGLAQVVAALAVLSMTFGTLAGLGRTGPPVEGASGGALPRGSLQLAQALGKDVGAEQ